MDHYAREMQTIQIDELRRREEQRLLPAIQAWEQAKRDLESAIATAETREKDYRTLLAEVDQRLQALNVVVQMNNELMPETVAGPRLIEPPVRPPNTLEERVAAPIAVSAAAPLQPRDAKPAEAAEAPKGASMGRSSRPLFPATWRAKYQLSILQQ